MFLRTVAGISTSVAMGILLAACVKSGTYRVGCDVGQSDPQCRIEVEGNFKMSPSGTELDTYDLAQFDASKLRANVAETSMTLKTGSSPQFAISLYRSGSLVASRTFTGIVSSTGIIRPADPTSFTSWIRQYSGDVDNYSVGVTGLEYTMHSGTNTFTAEIIYDSEIQGGDSTSAYVNPICYAKPWMCSDVDSPYFD